MFSRVKGTQDFLDLTLFNFIIDKAKHHLTTYHFTEIATPILESVALFKRSLGLYTDVVSKEMFIIAAGEHDEEAICLRPEATAPIVRAFVENNVQQTPWKVFTWGPMFRYERPQKGRYRQFHQISMEVIGSKSVMQDVQFIKMLDRFFHEQLSFNNYALLLNYLGCSQDRINYEAILKKFLDTQGAGKIDELCMIRKEKNVMRVFDCKNPQCQEVYKDAPLITDYLCPACEVEWKQLQEMLQLLSVSFVVKPTLVRGLDYYNKTVFEFTSDELGAQSAFCAGGRYDQLVAQIGGKEDQPSLGAALGIERLMLILQQVNVLPLPQLPPLHVIIPVTQEQTGVALILADELQAHSLATEVLVDGESMKSMMRKANKLGAKFCLIIGADEQNAHEVSVKNMVTGEEKRVPQVEVVSYLSL
ncbi:MAG TPA: histidine--tRNA ligase [Candidatus Babeliales bacterium]|nr:histidine--tRNA ligase [Candidatus Babeliales bacterium]